MRHILLIVSLVAFATGALAQSPVLLKVDARTGSKYVYRLDAKFVAEGANGSMGFSALMTDALKSNKGKDQVWSISFKVLSTYANGVMQGADASFKELDGVSMESFSDSRGQIRKMRLAGVEVPNNGTPSIVFSPKPVKVGSKWPSSVDMNGKQVKVEYTLKSLKKEGGRKVAYIEGLYLPSTIVRNVTPVRFWVDTKDGKMIRAEARILVTNQGQTVRLEYDIKRQG